MSEQREPSDPKRRLRTVIHDLRQPLSALQVWVDLLADTLGNASEAQRRYVAKIRTEVTRMTELLARAGEEGSEGAQPEPARPGTQQDAGLLPGACLLVVEDDEVTAEALQLALEGEGATVVLAATVADALALHEASRPDAVLSDLRIADGDGCALLVDIRRADAAAGRRTVAVALTGLDHPDAHASAREAGFDEVVVKPFSISQLVEMLARLLAAR